MSPRSLKRKIEIKAEMVDNAQVDMFDVKNESDDEDVEDEEASSTPSKSRKTSLNVLELATCPICLEFPRRGQLNGCKNGHIVCEKCRKLCETRE